MNIQFVTYDETYIINDLNQFSRPKLTAQYSNVGLPSNDWAMTGAIEYKFGNVFKEYSMEDVWDKKVPWFYKNGKQRCFVVQYDHGFKTVMISPKLVDVRHY